MTCYCCCSDEPVRLLPMGGECPEETRDEEFHQTLDPEGSIFPCGS